MEVRLLDKTEYELSKALWLECFQEDNKDFVDLYYSKRSRSDRVLGAFDGTEAPIAMMHLIPMKMPFGGSVKDICFVAGVCTKPGYRRRGICAMLFESAFSIMREKGFDAAVLDPFRESFYERFGFKTFIFRDVFTVSAERLNEIGRAYEAPFAPDLALMAEQYAAFLKGYSAYSLRGADAFEYFIDEYSMDGAVLNCSLNGCCAGYDEGGKLIVNELFCFPGTDPLSLLPSGYGEYSFPLPKDLSPGIPLSGKRTGFSMIKPLAEGFDPFLYRNYGFDMY